MIALSSKSFLVAIFVLAAVCSLAAAQYGSGGGYGRGFGGGYNRGGGGYGGGYNRLLPLEVACLCEERERSPRRWDVERSSRGREVDRSPRLSLERSPRGRDCDLSPRLSLRPHRGGKESDRLR
ncbi:hypothetical protein MTO96_031630 [Rhipicephalus appendiculatus]